MTKNLKSGIVFFVVAVMICAAFAGIVSYNTKKTEVFAENEDIILTLQIGNPKMTVGGEEQNVDDSGTAPVIVNERTLLPVRAIIEAVGGTVGWEADTRTAILNYGEDEIRLVIDSTTAYLNNEATELDTAPAIINDRTMLPIRFIAESFNFTVDWDGTTETVTITIPNETVSNTDNHETETADARIVYMTTEITPESLVKIYEQLNFNADGKTAVKMSTGESARSNYLRPELIGDLVQSVDGTIVECNTAYGGSRASTAAHWEAVKERGLDKIASYDPVALDQACIDLVYAERDNGAQSLISRIESRNGLHTLEHAEEIGLGSRAYNLVSIDS